jgi:hypothetical protein
VRGWRNAQEHTKSKKLIAGRLVDTEEQVTVKVTQTAAPVVAWEHPTSSSSSAPEPPKVSTGSTRPLDAETEQERARLATLATTMAAEDELMRSKRLATMQMLRSSWAAQVSASQQRKAEAQSFADAWPWASQPSFYSREAVHAWK